MRPITLLFAVSLIFLCQSFGQKNSHADSTALPPLLIKLDTIPEYQKLFCRVVEKEPIFQNGPADWQKYLCDNLNYAVIEKECPPGRYTVSIVFIITRDGMVDEIKATTNHGFGLEAEAIRVICLSPKWTPATRNGRNVIFRHLQSVTFEICEQWPNDLVSKNGKKMFSYTLR